MLIDFMENGLYNHFEDTPASGLRGFLFITGLDVQCLGVVPIAGSGHQKLGKDYFADTDRSVTAGQLLESLCNRTAAGVITGFLKTFLLLDGQCLFHVGNRGCCYCSKKMAWS
jgi:hypothetical protein